MGGLAGFLGGFSGSTLGRVLVEVGVDTSALKKGLAEAKSSTTSFGMISTAVFAAVAVAGLAFAKASVEAALKYEAAVAKLTVVAGANTDAFLKMAAAQSRLTTYTQTQIVSGMAQLDVLHLTQAQMATLLPIVEDYARFTGKDLTSAAMDFTKGAAGTVRFLTSMGIHFKKTGNDAADFQTKIKMVESVVHGANAAFAQTAAGQLAAFSTALDDMKVRLGQGLIPVMESLVKTAASLLPLFTALGFTLLTVVAAVKLVIAAGEDLHAFMGNLANDFLDFIGISHKAADAGGHFARAMNDNTKMLNDYLKGVSASTGATGQFTTAQQRSDATVKALTDHLRAQKLAQDALAGGLVGIAAQREQLAAAQATLTGEKDPKKRTADVLAVLQQQLSLNAAIKDYKNNLKASGDESGQALNMLKKLEHQAGLTAGQVERLNRSLAGIGGSINAGNAAGAVQAIADAVARHLRMVTAGG